MEDENQEVQNTQNTETQEPLVDVMAYDEARYLGIGSAESTNFQLMNVGVSKMEENTSPKEKNTQYVGDKSDTTKVTGYSNAFSLEMDLIKNQVVIEDLHDILYYRKTGVDAQRPVILVDLWKPIEGQTGVYRARKILTTASMTGKIPAPGEQIKLNGDLKGIGDFQYGTFDVATKAFTETSNS